jgi:hypothetical protein
VCTTIFQGQAQGDPPDSKRWSAADLCADPALASCATQLILGSFGKIAEDSGAAVASYEMPRALLLEPDPWGLRGWLHNGND